MASNEDNLKKLDELRDRFNKAEQEYRDQFWASTSYLRDLVGGDRLFPHELVTRDLEPKGKDLLDVHKEIIKHIKKMCKDHHQNLRFK